MPPRLRKTTLTAHVASSVGWLGAVAVFLVLAVTGFTAEDESSMRAAYSMMEVIGWSALVPLSIASLATGFIQSLGTGWGLIRHYWVLMKLLITVVATGVLLMYMETLNILADAAGAPAVGQQSEGILPSFSPVLHSGAALLLLLVAVGLSIYKPKGLTGLGFTSK